jgi:hypothetical protein
MLGASALILSTAFLIRSISPVYASQGNSKVMMVPVNADGSINVTLSDAQLNKIVPKNTDGSVNIKLSDAQIKDLKKPMGEYSYFVGGASGIYQVRYDSYYNHSYVEKVWPK